MKKTLIFLIIMVCSLSLFAGIEWTTEMKTSGKNKHENNQISTRTFAQGGDVKQVFEGVTNENQLYKQNGYWLYKADSDNIYVVDETKKTYMIMNLDNLLQVAGMMGQLVKISIIDHSIEANVLPNEEIMGYNCHHMKVVTDYTMKMKIAFIKKTMKVHEEKEIWGTTTLKGMNDINKNFMRKDFKTGITDLDEMIQKQMSKLKEVGFPLKVVTLTSQLNKKGKVKSTSTTTMEVKEIKYKDFPKSLFDIPAGYEEVTMPGSKGLF